MGQLVGFRTLVPLIGQTVGLLGFAAALACSSEDEPSTGTGGQAGSGGQVGSGGQAGSGGSSGAASAGGGNATTSDEIVGSFSVTLTEEAANGDAAYTAVAGKVYSGPTPTDVIETPLLSASGCTAYKYSQQPCIEVDCSSSQKCAAPEECRDLPTRVSVGEVSLAGLSAGTLTLTATNNDYQYPLNLDYPGLADGATISLTASGSHYPAFSISTTGIAPMVLTASSYYLEGGSPLLVEWAAGQNSAARISLLLDLTHHGGSAGYMECDVADSGSFTIPADVLQELLNLGATGQPKLKATRYTQGLVAVSGGRIALNISSSSLPTLNVEGVCSCNDAADCGSCADTTLTVCDSTRRLCISP